MREAARSGFLEATDIAELLVLEGVPFRSAYGAAKRAVLACLERGHRSADLTDADLGAVSPLFAEAGIGSDRLAAYLDLDACVARRSLTGGPAPERTREEIARLRLLAPADHPRRKGIRFRNRRIGRGDPRRSRLGDRLFLGIGFLQQCRRRPDQEPDATVAAERRACAGQKELHPAGSLLCRPSHAAQR